MVHICEYHLPENEVEKQTAVSVLGAAVVISTGQNKTDLCILWGGGG